ncbi:hypothetical protein WJX72_007152 [[Myrmecia] bisecta]|uniref:Centromere protein J C-terminal domain-containing protein n=1 Tax=[Myrmecia] bisecta TaxID=41462 RepID=A0AAW1Q1P0_9CHLO
MHAGHAAASDADSWHASPVPPGSRFRSTAEWAALKAEEEMELEEFRALERQIGCEPGDLRSSMRTSGSAQPHVVWSNGHTELEFDDQAEWDSASVSFARSTGTEGGTPSRSRATGLLRSSNPRASQATSHAEPAQATSTLMQQLFHQHHSSTSQPVADETGCLGPASAQQPRPAAEQERSAALEAEVQRFQQERAKVDKLKTQLEHAIGRMEQEKIAFERRKAEEVAAWEKEREVEAHRLKRDRRVLEKQSRAILKLPNRKERGEVEALEAVLEQERKSGKAKEARHKLTVERLRRQIVELQDKNTELREEVRWHEAQRLKQWEGKPQSASKSNADPGAGFASADGATTPAPQHGYARSQSTAAGSPFRPALPDWMRSHDGDAMQWASPDRPARSQDRALGSSIVGRRISPTPAFVSPGRAPPRSLAGANARVKSFAAASLVTAAAADPDVNREAGTDRPSDGVSSQAGSSTAKPIQEMRYPDGKVEHVYGSGRRSVTFANGTVKEQFPDGSSAIRFTNGDIKKMLKSGRVEYYYAEVDTWQTTHPDGIEVFYFPNGQTEAHHPGGMKEILFPDRVIRRVYPDGREQEAAAGQLSSAVKQPRPSAGSG